MYIFSEKKTSVNVGQSNQNNNFSYTVSSMLKLINNKNCHKTDDVLRPKTKSICRQLKSAFNKFSTVTDISNAFSWNLYNFQIGSY